MITNLNMANPEMSAEVSANTWLADTWVEAPLKRKKHKKKSKKARKKAAKQARNRVSVQQLAAANYRCGYLSAENDMLKRMIALSVGAQRNRLDTTLLDGGLAMLPSGKKT